MNPCTRPTGFYLSLSLSLTVPLSCHTDSLQSSFRPKETTNFKQICPIYQMYNFDTQQKFYTKYNGSNGRSQWPRGLRRRSTAARLLRLWVKIPSGAWMSVCCECCVSSRGLCDELITRPEESYRLWWVAVCDLETSRSHGPRWAAAPPGGGGCVLMKCQLRSRNFADLR